MYSAQGCTRVARPTCPMAPVGSMVPPLTPPLYALPPIRSLLMEHQSSPQPPPPPPPPPPTTSNQSSPFSQSSAADDQMLIRCENHTHRIAHEIHARMRSANFASSSVPPPPSATTSSTSSPDWRAAAAGTGSSSPLSTPPAAASPSSSPYHAGLPGGGRRPGCGAGGGSSCSSVETKTKRPWSGEEDEALTALVKEVGPGLWAAIASRIPGRTGKQVRERWLNHLSPHVNKRPWGPEEDAIIIKAHLQLGNRWSRIAKMLDGRSDNSVKNRFYTTLKRRLAHPASAPASPPASPPDLCGLKRKAEPVEPEVRWAKKNPAWVR